MDSVARFTPPTIADELRIPWRDLFRHSDGTGDTTVKVENSEGQAASSSIESIMVIEEK